MRPELFHIGPLTVHAYGLMLAVAFLAAGVTASLGFRRRGLSYDNALAALVAAVAGGLVGAKLNYVILYPELWPQSLLSGEGLVWYGGLIGGAVGVLLVLRLTRTPLGPAADAIAPALAVGYGLGRIGCFLNGCCYGRESGLPWAVSFPVGSPPTNATVHPTQLYESLASFGIAIVLLVVLQPRLKARGALFWAYVGLAGLERLLVEFLRTNPVAWAGLTLQQWVSVGLVLSAGAGLAWLYVLRNHNEREVD